MLPDFAEIKKLFIAKVNAEMRAFIRKEPILSQIKHYRHYEGNQMNSQSMDGNVHDSRYRELSSKFDITKEEIISGGYSAFMERALKTAEDIQGQQVRAIFKTISDVTEKTGNVVDGKGKPFSPEMFLESLDKIYIDFDENGSPKFPSFVFHPKLRDKVLSSMAKLDADPALKKRHAEIIEKKRKEWNDREGNRKLVD